MKTIYLVFHKNRVPFGFDCDEENFSVVKAFTTYEKAFKYIQTKDPDISREHKGYGEFKNKKNTSIYKIEKIDLVED